MKINLFKYKSFVPISGLIVYLVILLLEEFVIIPNPRSSFGLFMNLYSDFSFLLIFIVILIESIVYFGFYFPGQLFAVLIVIGNDFTLFNVLILTIVSIIAVTISAAINYKLGSLLSEKKSKKFRIRDLLFSMLHINLLALYMFDLGKSRASKKSILFAGLLNVPYYLLLIFGTFLIKDYITIISEDGYYLFFLILGWAIITFIMDVRKFRKK